MGLENLKNLGKCPHFITQEGYDTISKGYLLPNETPYDMYKRVSDAAAYRLKKPELASIFFTILWNGWLGAATPVLSNMGTSRGLPISCFSLSPADSVDDIFMKQHELAMLSKNGGGVGIYLGDIRPRGAAVKGNGTSEGIIPWAKCFDSATLAVSQGSSRRGASAVYLPFSHGDIDEFLDIRKATGDINRRVHQLHNAVTITDEEMKAVIDGDPVLRQRWIKLLQARVELGEPYILFKDTVNNANPEAYKINNLSITTSNICCLAADTEVLTKQGIYPIAELVGKTVDIWNGKEWEKTNSFKKQGEDSLFRIYIKDGSYIDANANHRWFVSENYQQIANDKYKEVLTCDLKEKTWLEYHSVETHGTLKIKGAYIKGFLTGDGTYNNLRPILAMHSTKYNCEHKLVSSLEEIEQDYFGTNVITEVSFGKQFDNTGKYAAYGKQVFKLMKGLTARKTELTDWSSLYKTELPNFVYDLDKQSKLELLAGMYDSDGTYSRGTLQIASIHKNFIISLQKLIKTFGYSAGIDSSCRENRNPIYRLTLSNWDSYQLVKQMDVQRIKFTGNPPNRKTTGWRQILKIEKLEGKHPLYCPTVSTGKFALANGLMTGNSEITGYTDTNHTFVCCLSSLNLAKWEEFKDYVLPNGMSVVEASTWFLDGVMEEFIVKARNIPGFENSVRFAEKSRMLGLGAMGWHSLLQNKLLPFDSLQSMMLNAQIFSQIQRQSKKASQDMALQYGEPEWCKGLGLRNTHFTAIAPTVSNSIICGSVSSGIEPITSNAYALKSAKGVFIRKNLALETLLESKGLNTPDIWDDIIKSQGSVQHLKQLSSDEKNIFKTAREINQFALVKQAGQRQQFICQSQSLNLFFTAGASAKYINEVHLEAWKSKVKTLYYLRSETVLKGTAIEYTKEECAACEG